MKLKFFELFILLWQFNSIFAHPGIVEVNPPDTWKSREKVTTDALINTADYEIISTTPPTSTSSVQTLKINYDDVVLGANSVYGSHFNNDHSNTRFDSALMRGEINTRLSGNGILFAVNSKGITSSPQIMTADSPQPVLLQYLSPNGTPKTSSVQYIQVLRPLNQPAMSIPIPYLNPRPLPTPQISIDVKPITNQKASLIASAYKKSKSTPTSLIGASSDVSLVTKTSDISLNMNEYMPMPSEAASSRITTIVSPYSWNDKRVPSKNFQMTQRA